MFLPSQQITLICSGGGGKEGVRQGRREREGKRKGLVDGTRARGQGRGDVLPTNAGSDSAMGST
jgi:hypothetical protein